MNALYKVCVKGVFPDPPSCYSSDLKNLIRKMITVKPEMRPTCDQIINSKEVKKAIQKWKVNVSYLGFEENHVFASSQPANMRSKAKDQLMATI